MDADDLDRETERLPTPDGGAPICPACGVTMVPVDLSGCDEHDGDWVCLECEETGAADA